jgi:hypothetical protein
MPEEEQKFQKRVEKALLEHCELFDKKLQRKQCNMHSN